MHIPNRWVLLGMDYVVQKGESNQGEFALREWHPWLLPFDGSPPNEI